MSRRVDWEDDIRDVLSEYRVAALAVERLGGDSRNDPTLLDAGTRPRDVVRTRRKLEATYIVRMFAVFEAGLRSYWATVKDTSPPMRDLLTAISTRRKIDYEIQARADAAREYRNSLVHESASASIAPIGIVKVEASLAKYFGELPFEW